MKEQSNIEEANPHLAFSYYNSCFADGAGSQLQRIYGIYALARFLGASYIHTPLQKIFYHGFHSIETNQDDVHLVERYNELFVIPSDQPLSKYAKIHYLFRLKNDFSFLHSLKEQLIKSRNFVLLSIGCPFFLVNQQPEMIHHIKKVTPFERTPSSIFKIVLHVRRGDLLISPEKNRLLPNSYYINLNLQIIDVLRSLKIPFTCELHTEIPSKTLLVTAEHHSMKHRLEEQVLITPESQHMEEFATIPHLTIHNNDDPLAALRSFATADLFIMSRSSFSYLGAMLNKKGIIVYHPFWCATPLEWLDATHQPSFHERLIMACEKWKNQQKAPWSI